VFVLFLLLLGIVMSILINYVLPTRMLIQSYREEATRATPQERAGRARRARHKPLTHRKD